jgi:hypothetical protein
MEARAICGEVMVADNGSTDGSIESSEQAGGRDGWRTLCFFLPYGLKRPLVHGIVLMVFGVTGSPILASGATVFAGIIGSNLQ